MSFGFDTNTVPTWPGRLFVGGLPNRGETLVLQIGTAGAKGPNSNDTSGGVNGTPEPYWPADMAVDAKTNRLYVADGYGNRRVLIVDATTRRIVEANPAANRVIGTRVRRDSRFNVVYIDGHSVPRTRTVLGAKFAGGTRDEEWRMSRP